MMAKRGRAHHFRKRFKEVREVRGVSREMLAEAVGKTVQTIRNWEYGTATPGLNDLWKLCQALDVSADYLIGRSKTSDGSSYFSAPVELFERGVPEASAAASFLLPPELEAHWAVFLPREWTPTVQMIKPGDFVLVRDIEGEKSEPAAANRLVITVDLKIGRLKNGLMRYADGTAEPAGKILGIVVGVIAYFKGQEPPADIPPPPSVDRLINNLAEAVNIPKTALRRAVVALFEAAAAAGRKQADEKSPQPKMPFIPELLGSDWVSQAEVAELLGVSRQSINQLVKRGALYAHPIDRSVRLSEVVAYLESRGLEGKALLKKLDRSKREEIADA